MRLLLEFAARDPILIISIFLSIVALILMIILFRKNYKYKCLRYTLHDNNIVRDLSAKLTGLKVSFKKKYVKNVTVSKIAFWNSGTEVINKIDFADKDPLRIETDKDYEILDVKIIYMTKEANDFEIPPSYVKSKISSLPIETTVISNKEQRITFDYLGRNEGGIIQIVHNGVDSQVLKILGTIKGAKPPKKLDLVSYSKMKEPFSKRLISNLSGIPLFIIFLINNELGWLYASFIFTVFGTIYNIGFRKQLPTDLDKKLH